MAAEPLDLGEEDMEGNSTKSLVRKRKKPNVKSIRKKMIVAVSVYGSEAKRLEEIKSMF